MPQNATAKQIPFLYRYFPHLWSAFIYICAKTTGWWSQPVAFQLIARVSARDASDRNVSRLYKNSTSVIASELMICSTLS